MHKHNLAKVHFRQYIKLFISPKLKIFVQQPQSSTPTFVYILNFVNRLIVPLQLFCVIPKSIHWLKGGRNLTTMRIQKYAKSCCHKTNLGNYFDDPTLPTGSLRCTCAARRLGYCTQEAVLSQRAAKCGLHNSVKLSQCSPELDFSLFCDILGEWTITFFFVKYTLKNRALYAAST